MLSIKTKFLFGFLVLLCWRAPSLLCQESVAKGVGVAITVEDYCCYLNAEQAVDCRLQATGSEKTTNYSDRFLGTITASNLNDLYDERMLGVLIMRTGLPGNYCCNLISKTSADRFNPCIVGLSWNDAERYCDWKNHSALTLVASTYNLNSCAIGAAHADHSLKSNQLTFRLVSTGASAYQAGGPEVAGAAGAEEVGAEVAATLAWIVSIVEGDSRRPEAVLTEDLSSRAPPLTKTSLEEAINSRAERKKNYGAVPFALSSPVTTDSSFPTLVIDAKEIEYSFEKAQELKTKAAWEDAYERLRKCNTMTEQKGRCFDRKKMISQIKLAFLRGKDFDERFIGLADSLRKSYDKKNQIKNNFTKEFGTLYKDILKCCIRARYRVNSSPSRMDESENSYDNHVARLSDYNMASALRKVIKAYQKVMQVHPIDYDNDEIKIDDGKNVFWEEELTWALATKEKINLLLSKKIPGEDFQESPTNIQDLLKLEPHSHFKENQHDRIEDLEKGSDSTVQRSEAIIANRLADSLSQFGSVQGIITDADFFRSLSTADLKLLFKKLTIEQERRGTCKETENSHRSLLRSLSESSIRHSSNISIQSDEAVPLAPRFPEECCRAAEDCWKEETNLVMEIAPEAVDFVKKHKSYKKDHLEVEETAKIKGPALKQQELLRGWRAPLVFASAMLGLGLIGDMNVINHGLCSWHENRVEPLFSDGLFSFADQTRGWLGCHDTNNLNAEEAAPAAWEEAIQRVKQFQTTYDQIEGSQKESDADQNIQEGKEAAEEL